MLLAMIGVVAVVGLFLVSRRGGEPAVPPTPAPSQTSQPSSSSAAKPEAPAQKNVPGDKSAAPSPKRAAGSLGLPGPVARALDAKKTVVILFFNPAGVDDRSVKNSVDRLSRRHGRVVKFTDSVKNLSRYTRVTTAASVSQTPALVIVNRRGQAEVLNGYYDFQTINQFVSNASRRK